MQIVHPRRPETFTTEDRLSLAFELSIHKEETISGIESHKQQLIGETFRRLDIRQSRFESCNFSECDMLGASFIDVTFSNCNFSGTHLMESYFQRCRFLSCKGTGIDLRYSVLKQVAFEDCNLRYAALDESRITDMGFLRVDFEQGSMEQAKLKGFHIEESTFVRTNFFQTTLTGVDFSNSILLAPIVSWPPAELRGIHISALQAADLISLWGIIVE